MIRAQAKSTNARRVGSGAVVCIFASGNLSGTFKRKFTGRIAWDEAKAVAAEWEKARSWDGEIPLPAAPLPEPTPSRATIERAVKVFLDELRESIAPATHKKYRLLLTKFKEFSAARGYVVIDQWDPTYTACSSRHGLLARQLPCVTWGC